MWSTTLSWFPERSTIIPLVANNPAIPLASPNFTCSRKCRCSPCMGRRNCGDTISWIFDISGLFAWPDTWYLPELSSTTSTPFSDSLLINLITPLSFPGIVFDENRKRSPSPRVIPWYFPLASWADAARLSPCDPVTISKRFRFGTFLASSGDIKFGKSDNTPDSIETSIILFIALPIKQTDLPASSAASASDLIRATLLAKVVATTISEHFSINLRISGATSDSDRPSFSENTFVLSHMKARTPLEQTFFHIWWSKASPTTGFSSSLKSPLWINRPFGVSITKALLSGIECDTGI